MTKKSATTTTSSTIDRLAKMRADMIAVALELPEVAEAATAILKKTIAWAERTGIVMATTKSTVSAQAKNVGKVFDRVFDGGNSGFNSNQWTALKELIESIVGEPIVSKSVAGSSAKVKYEAGTSVKMVANVHKHSYTVGATLFVTDPQNLIAVNDAGATPPTGFHLDPEPTSVGVPSESEIVIALANLYVANPGKFLEVATQASSK
jgi:hypothetical protein